MSVAPDADLLAENERLKSCMQQEQDLSNAMHGEIESLRDALRAIAHHAREGDYAGQVNAMRAIAAEALDAS